MKPLPILSILLILINPLSAQDPEIRSDISFFNVNAGTAMTQLAERFSSELHPLNIVVAPEAKDIVLPDMKLKQVSFDQIASFLNQIGGAMVAKGNDDDPFGGGSPSPVMPLRPAGERFGLTLSAGIWYFWSDKSFAVKQKAELLTMVMYLGSEAEMILSLIDEALSSKKRDYSPVLKFHKPTQSLIATADEPDLTLIDRAVEDFVDSGYRGLEKENAALSARISELEAKIAALVAKGESN